MPIDDPIAIVFLAIFALAIARWIHVVRWMGRNIDEKQLREMVFGKEERDGERR